MINFEKLSRFIMTYVLSAFLLMNLIECMVKLSQWNFEGAMKYGVIVLGSSLFQLAWYYAEREEAKAVAYQSAKKSLDLDEGTEAEDELTLTKVFKK